MDFGKQIKQLRNDRNLTQEQMAEKLFVSRQAVSNWENNKNLPDLELVILMSTTFHISLDELILGGNDMNNMTEKLIKDGSETRRAKFNMIAYSIAGALMLIGFACFVIKSFTPEYVDATGILHEQFFWVPIGFLFLFTGILVFFSVGIKNIITRLMKKK